ncbi:MAG: hypothetical protein V5A28_12400 [Haloarculaceae archaeon]
MVSRDTTVHAAVVTVSVAALLALGWAFPDVAPPVLTLALLVLYGFVLAGAHLFLAWRGEGGAVPVSSRWRFVGVVAGVLVLGGISLLTDPVSLGPVSSDSVLAALAVAGILAYWLLEARSGYADASDGS